MGSAVSLRPLPQVVTQCYRWHHIIAVFAGTVCVPVTIYLSPHAPMWLKLITGISAVISTVWAINFLYRFPVGTRISDVKKHAAKIFLILVHLSALVVGVGSAFIVSLD